VLSQIESHSGNGMEFLVDTRKGRSSIKSKDVILKHFGILYGTDFLLYRGSSPKDNITNTLGSFFFPGSMSGGYKPNGHQEGLHGLRPDTIVGSIQDGDKGDSVARRHGIDLIR
jgi:hypothetical protein